MDKFDISKNYLVISTLWSLKNSSHGIIIPTCPMHAFSFLEGIMLLCARCCHWIHTSTLGLDLYSFSSFLLLEHFFFIFFFSSLLLKSLVYKNCSLQLVFICYNSFSCWNVGLFLPLEHLISIYIVLFHFCCWNALHIQIHSLQLVLVCYKSHWHLNIGHVFHIFYLFFVTLCIFVIHFFCENIFSHVWWQ